MDTSNRPRHARGIPLGRPLFSAAFYGVPISFLGRRVRLWDHGGGAGNCQQSTTVCYTGLRGDQVERQRDPLVLKALEILGP
jgi:hypothetical protein